MDFEQLTKRIEQVRQQYRLTELRFDTECIYNPGDLSYLLRSIVNTTLPEFGINVRERTSDDGLLYIATLSNQHAEMVFNTETTTDWLSDDFCMQFEDIPKVFNTGKVYYSINPALGLTGQDVWYFCGTEENLKQARAAGIPIVFPGEDIWAAPEMKWLDE